MASEDTSTFPSGTNAEAFHKRQLSRKPAVRFKPIIGDVEDPKKAYTVSINLDEEGKINQRVPQHSGGTIEQNLQFLQAMYQLGESKGIIPAVKTLIEEQDVLEEKREVLEYSVPTGDNADIEVDDDMSVESAILTGDESDEDESSSRRRRRKRNRGKPRSSPRVISMQQRLRILRNESRLGSKKNPSWFLSLSTCSRDVLMVPNVSPIRPLQET